MASRPVNGPFPVDTGGCHVWIYHVHGGFVTQIADHADTLLAARLGLLPLAGDTSP
jgi:hypothetical protein